jgi:hypothetical protein
MFLGIDVMGSGEANLTDCPEKPPKVLANDFLPTKSFE